LSLIILAFASACDSFLDLALALSLESRHALLLYSALHFNKLHLFAISFDGTCCRVAIHLAKEWLERLGLGTVIKRLAVEVSLCHLQLTLSIFCIALRLVEGLP
jgi:hypothetical protein